MELAEVFGAALNEAFRLESALVPFSEIQQFRALMRAFTRLAPQFFVEEYHGAKHQVLFNGRGAWGRNPARCELCDLVFVAFRTRPSVALRVTFLQAKLSKERHPGLCLHYPITADDVAFKANLEQWDLLARRPVVLAVPPFKVHPLP